MADVNDIPDAELVRRVIATAAEKRRGRGYCPLWSVVGDRFMLGSTYAAQLCRRFGFDAEKQVRP